MVIVINAVAAKMGGAATNLRTLVDELKKRADSHRFVFFVPTTQSGLGRDLPDNIEWRPTRAGEGGWPRRLWWDQVVLRSLLKREHADVLYSFSDFAVLRCPVPQLLFVRNSVIFSELYQRHVLPRKDVWFRFLYRLRRWLVCRSVEAADAVMTPSASMLEMVRRAVAVPDGKALVNYYGAPNSGPSPTPPRDYSGTIRLLFPTFYTEHKNFGIALQALSLLRKKHGTRFILVSTADPRWEKEIETVIRKRDQQLADELARKGALEIRGALSHEELLALIQQCHILCYPTLTESFGHPLVEAMQAALPIVASDIPVNREIAQEAALYFDPSSPRQLAEQIEKIIQEDSLRLDLQRRAREYAASFSWQRHCAELFSRLDQLALTNKNRVKKKWQESRSSS